MGDLSSGKCPICGNNGFKVSGVITRETGILSQRLAMPTMQGKPPQFLPTAPPHVPIPPLTFKRSDYIGNVTIGGLSLLAVFATIALINITNDVVTGTIAGNILTIFLYAILFLIDFVSVAYILFRITQYERALVVHQQKQINQQAANEAEKEIWKKQEEARKTEFESSEQKRWATESQIINDAQRKWEELYYCYHDDVVFLGDRPSNAVPPKEMNTLLGLSGNLKYLKR